MANPEHLAKLKEGVEVWNKWRLQHREVTPDLRKADLRRANLRGAMLDWARLDGAQLVEADLREANLNFTSLHQANLSRANLWMATLVETRLARAKLTRARLIGAIARRADLSGADLSKADLSGTDLDGAELDRTRMADAVVGNTAFGGGDFSTVQGLDSVKHLFPSTIGVETIYRSKGKIPESFLRGCGVPDDFILFAKSLAANPIEFYSCFISYSTKDQEFADRLYADLQNKGVRCWFAPHDINAGKKIHEQIDDAIRVHDKLLLILSPHSMESEWVKTEIAKARKREVRNQRRVLFPIRLAPFAALRDWECFDADTGKDSAREIREYFIPDFSNWKNHDSYREGFKRLLKALKTQA
jgi:uncharacterized protein YjbI with pentapeptide repeats